jgi:hypothetical protein
VLRAMVLTVTVESVGLLSSSGSRRATISNWPL